MRNINPFGLRMQPDLRAKVEEAAAQNHRSLNAEIVARLEASFIQPGTIIFADEFHYAKSPAERALEALEMIRAELIAIKTTSEK